MSEVLIIAIVLGIVEGLTEFLPVSSTGHLILFGEAFKFKNETAEAFEIVIQVGAILAAVVMYRRRFLTLLPQNKLKTGLNGLSGCYRLAVGCLPALVVGGLFHKQIKAVLFAPQPIAVAFIVGGLVMIWVESQKRDLTRTVDEITYRDAFIIGCVQTLALWPGVSRSGATMIAALLLGFSRTAAAEFSFLMAVPLLSIAAAHSFIKDYHLFTADSFVVLLVGMITAFVAAALAIKAFLAFLTNFTLRPFAYYRIVLGLVLLYFL